MEDVLTVPSVFVLQDRRLVTRCPLFMVEIVHSQVSGLS